MADDDHSDSPVPTPQSPPHHSPARTRTLSIVDSKAAASTQAMNRKFANMRSRADWKQASHQLPRPEAEEEGRPDELRPISPSPSGPVSPPPDLPPPIPPHSYTFIPRIEAPAAGGASGGPPAASGGASAAAPPPQPPPPPAAPPAPTVTSASPAAQAPATAPPSASTPPAPTSPVRSSFDRNPPTSTNPLPRPHVCALCSLAFARGHDLKRHTATHTGEKKFKCPNCGRAYGRKDALKRHACASTGQQQQAVFAVNGGGVGGSPSASRSPAAAIADARLGALPVPPRRGQLHAPPIVGAAANLLGPKSQRPIKYKNSTPSDFGGAAARPSGTAAPDDSEMGANDLPGAEKDELEGDAGEDHAMSTSPIEANSKSSAERASGSGSGGDEDAEEEDDVDAEGEGD